MILINLLPFRKARKKENIRQQLSVYFLSMLFLTLLMSYFVFNLNQKIEIIDNRINASTQELASLNFLLQEINEIKKNLDKIKSKITIIKNLEENRKASVVLLDTMTKTVIPERMWLTRLSSSGESVELTGIAMDNKTVADFMSRLEGCQLFSSVSLKSIKQHIIRNVSLKIFEISCKKTISLGKDSSEPIEKK